MRASIRGSIRSVMVTDSDASALPAVADSMRRRSGRFSAQNSASASSLSKRGPSSHLANARITKKIDGLLERRLRHPTIHLSINPTIQKFRVSLGKSLPHFALVEETFFRLKRPRKHHPDLPSVGAIDAHDADATRRHAEVEKPRLHAEPRRVGHQPHGKCVFKGLLNFPLIQRTKLKRRVIPIELHNGSVVNKSPMQCEYNVFTHAGDLLSSSGF